MTRRFPQDSFFGAVWLPMIHAALQLQRGNPARAVELLQPAGRDELGTDAALWPAYLRGLAYLARGAGAEARAEFQKILDHKGVLAPKDFNPAGMTLYPLAQLGRARAETRIGELDASRKAYQELLALWKDADTDIPVLRAAQHEYRLLGSSHAVADETTARR
jgi:tetratricopeptide (TPR) repeat protein